MVNNSPANAGDAGLIPGWGRSPGGGNGNPLQHSCLGNHWDKAAWQPTVHGVARVRHDLATNNSKILRKHFLFGFHFNVEFFL